MWAYTLEAPSRLALTTVKDPTRCSLVEGQVLVEVTAIGVCGSDIPKFLGRSPTPSVPGWPAHEIVGVVLDSESSSLDVGTRVAGFAGNHNGLSQIVVCSADTLIAVNEQLSDIPAVLIQPLATVHAALSRVGGLSGARVAVIGLGPLGLLNAYLAKTLGAASVIGVDCVDRRAEAGAKWVDEMIWAASRAWAQTVADQDRPSVVIEAVGHQVGTLNDAISVAAPDGHLVGFGVPDESHYPVNYWQFFRKRLTLTAGTTHPWDTHLEASQNHILAHPELVSSLVSHVLPIYEAQRAYELAATPAPGTVKVVLAVAQE